jgi:hypothetical protein
MRYMGTLTLLRDVGITGRANKLADIRTSNPIVFLNILKVLLKIAACVEFMVWVFFLG